MDKIDEWVDLIAGVLLVVICAMLVALFAWVLFLT